MLWHLFLGNENEYLKSLLHLTLTNHQSFTIRISENSWHKNTICTTTYIIYSRTICSILYLFKLGVSCTLNYKTILSVKPVWILTVSLPLPLYEQSWVIWTTEYKNTPLYLLAVIYILNSISSGQFVNELYPYFHSRTVRLIK
jgi:hypothetical protein